MEIRIHIVSGACHRFLVRSPEDAVRILKPVTPVKLFTQPQFVIKGTKMMQGFASALVEEVEFLTDIDPGWVHPNGMPRLEKVSEDRYRAHVEKIDAREDSPPPSPGETFTAVGLFTMKSGRNVCLEYDAVARSAVDQRHAIHGILQAGGFYVKSESGGHSVINAGNLAGFVFHPGPAQGPVNTWHAEPVEQD